MKIIICDDSPRDLAGMKELLEKYCESRACPAPELEQTSDSAALYRRIQNGEQWDVYILDILPRSRPGEGTGKTYVFCRRRCAVYGGRAKGPLQHKFSKYLLDGRRMAAYNAIVT